jgi:hypothetical protein
MPKLKRIVFLPLVLIVAALVLACSTDSNAAGGPDDVPTVASDGFGAAGTVLEGTVGDWNDTPFGDKPVSPQLPPGSGPAPHPLPSGSGGPPPFPSDLQPPPAKVTLPDGRAIEAATGTYCWTDAAGRSLCVDKIGVITAIEATAVKPGATLLLNNGLDSAAIGSVSVQAFAATGQPKMVGAELAWPYEFAAAVDLNSASTPAGISLEASLIRAGGSSASS